MAQIDTEKSTITFGIKELITSGIAIIIFMCGIFYFFYNLGISSMQDKHDSVMKTVESMQNDIDQTKGNVTDVRDMQIKLNTYLEIILKQTIDKKSVATDTKGESSPHP